MADWQDGYWWSNDGLRLHYRDYPGGIDGRPPIVCIPGLTRNARDYHELAMRLKEGWRVIAVDLRGRGESGYAKDALSYVPLTYVQDIERMLGELAIDRFVAVGTSLGGIVTMLLATTGRDRLTGAVLNDVGPEIDPAGLTRIRSYVGKSANHQTWMHAARALVDTNATVHPTWRIDDWLAMAKRLHRVTPGGRIVLDYDMRIAEPFRVPGNESGADLWPALDALRDVPTAIIRGQMSDILSDDTASRMVETLPLSVLTRIPNTGHAPTLAEEGAIKAIDDLLDRAIA